VPAKPVDGILAAVERWQAFLRDGGMRARPFRVVVVGGGAGGVELVLALHHRFSRVAEGATRDRPAAEFHLVSSDAAVPSGHAPAVQRRMTRHLVAGGIRLHLGQRVAEVTPDEVIGAAGERLGFNALVWVTEAAAPAWVRNSGLATDDRGFLRVDACLRSTSHPFVFAAGDVAVQWEFPRPKSGVFAVRQGPPLAWNLAASVQGEPLRRHRPQRRFLSLISTGARHAVGSYGPWAWSGDWVWRWKDHIDRRWMAMYQRAMPSRNRARTAESLAREGPMDVMRCAGCGGKVSAAILERVLARLPRGTVSADTLWDMSAREDASAIRVPAGRVLVQSVDYFRAMGSDPYLVGRVAATHALSDLHAKGALPHSALALVSVPWGSDGVVEEQLFQVLAGAVAQFELESVILLGGHTAEGSELAVGFTVNGFAEPSVLLAKSGAKRGDRLVLTKPIGAGILLAAEMRGELRAAYRDPLMESLLKSTAGAGRCLREHGATACTDVTGFGLCGHLGEILRASRVAARVRADLVPLLPGVRERAQAGFRSSLAPENLALARKVPLSGETATWDEVTWLLLTDPQTSGGLLATVPAAQVTACLEALREAGCPDAAEIGEIVEASGEDVGGF
jgi:selenide, water dikinase